MSCAASDVSGVRASIIQDNNKAVLSIDWFPTLSADVGWKGYKEDKLGDYR